MKYVVPRLLGFSVFLLFQFTMCQVITARQNPTITGVAQNHAAGASSASPDVLDRQSNVGDPLLDVPPLPNGKVTLIGGRISKIDPVRDRIVVEPFGGGAMKVLFDERTHIYRDGTETTQANIHKGDRVYVDTMLDGPHVFARNIRVMTQPTATDAVGQVLSYNRQSGVLAISSQFSQQPVNLAVGPQTVITKEGNAAGTATDLQEGMLVSVRFSPEVGQRSTAQQISILAVPGTTATFVGKVTHVDLRSGVIAVDNQSDHKTYDISFDPVKNKLSDEITVGSQVKVMATFTGKGYQAENISLSQ